VQGLVQADIPRVRRAERERGQVQPARRVG